VAFPGKGVNVRERLWWWAQGHIPEVPRRWCPACRVSDLYAWIAYRKDYPE